MAPKHQQRTVRRGASPPSGAARAPAVPEQVFVAILFG